MIAHLTSCALALSAQGATSVDPEQVLRTAAARLHDLGFEVDVEELRLEPRGKEGFLAGVRVQQTNLLGTGYLEQLFAIHRAFGSEEASSPTEFASLLAEGSASLLLAYYRPGEGTVVVATEPLLDGSDPVALVAHELAHAWRDERTPLLDWICGATTLDERSVRYAMMEGEAEVISWASAQEEPREALRSVGPGDLDYSFGQTLTGGRMLTYEKGAHFVSRIDRRNGWEGVEAAWRTPPASSEQLLHSAKLGTDVPADVHLPAWSEEGTSSAHETVVGELAILDLLRTFGVGRSESFLAAAGWDGDRLALVEHPEDGEALVWRTVWDRPEDAGQFLAAVEDLFVGSALRRGRTVDLVHASSEALRARLAAELARLPEPEADPRDAVSTRAVEEHWLAEHRSGPHAADGWWMLPEAQARLKIPAGWEQRGSGYPAFLFGRTRDTFTENVNVIIQSKQGGPPMEEIVEQLLAAGQPLGGGELVWMERRELFGHPAAVRVEETRSGEHETALLGAIAFNGESVLIITMTSIRDGWEETEAFFEDLLSGFESLP